MPRVALIAATLLLLACNRDSPTAPMGPAPCQGISLGGTARVAGLVTLSSLPVRGAVVTIGARSATTQESGEFSIGDVPGGLQSFHVQAEPSASASGEMLVLRGHNDVRIATARQDQGNEGTLSGRTIDGCSGDPLAGVTVKFPSTAIEVTSGPDGNFQFGNLCCSTLGEVSASKPGYRTSRASVGRAYGRGLWLDLVLMPE